MKKLKALMEENFGNKVNWRIESQYQHEAGEQNTTLSHTIFSLFNNKGDNILSFDASDIFDTLDILDLDKKSKLRQRTSLDVDSENKLVSICIVALIEDKLKNAQTLVSFEELCDIVEEVGFHLEMNRKPSRTDLNLINHNCTKTFNLKSAQLIVEDSISLSSDSLGATAKKHSLGVFEKDNLFKSLKDLNLVDIKEGKTINNECNYNNIEGISASRDEKILFGGKDSVSLNELRNKSVNTRSSIASSISSNAGKVGLNASNQFEESRRQFEESKKQIKDLKKSFFSEFEISDTGENIEKFRPSSLFTPDSSYTFRRTETHETIVEKGKTKENSKSEHSFAVGRS